MPRRPGHPGRLAAVLSLALAVPCGRAEELRIGTVRLVTLDVYGPEEAARGWPYRAANKLHLSTRARVIRRFLLFREGDPYDAERLAQTERNLRELPFLRSASVTASPPRDGVVDVEVATQDAWTTGVGGSFGSEGGRTVAGAAIEEKNLLGTGRELEIEWDSHADRIQRQIEIHDPYLLGRYFRGDLLYSDNSDGSQWKASIARPFFALHVPWATAASVERVDEVLRVYDAGVETSRFRHRHLDAGAEYGRALLARDHAVLRLTGGIRILEDTFLPVEDHPHGDLPEDRMFRYVLGRLAWVEHDWVKHDYVNRDVRVEDFNLGRQASLLAAVSPAGGSVPETTGLVETAVSRGRRLGERGFIIGSLRLEGRLEPEPRNAILEADCLYVRKLDTRLRQTFVSRLHVQKGWRLDGERQFFADGATGLRGYELHRFAGDDAVVLNMEHRLFRGKEIFQLLAPGMALFVDVGAATPEGEALGVDDLRADIGIGLRLGIARAATNNMLRLDVAYPSEPDAEGRREVLVSFSSGQSF